MVCGPGWAESCDLIHTRQSLESFYLYTLLTTEIGQITQHPSKSVKNINRSSTTEAQTRLRIAGSYQETRPHLSDCAFFKEGGEALLSPPSFGRADPTLLRGSKGLIPPRIGPLVFGDGGSCQRCEAHYNPPSYFYK